MRKNYTAYIAAGILGFILLGGYVYLGKKYSLEAAFYADCESMLNERLVRSDSWEPRGAALPLGLFREADERGVDEYFKLVGDNRLREQVTQSGAKVYRYWVEIVGSALNQAGIRVNDAHGMCTYAAIKNGDGSVEGAVWQYSFFDPKGVFSGGKDSGYVYLNERADRVVSVGGLASPSFVWKMMMDNIETFTQQEYEEKQAEMRAERERVALNEPPKVEIGGWIVTDSKSPIDDKVTTRASLHFVYYDHYGKERPTMLTVRCIDQELELYVVFDGAFFSDLGRNKQQITFRLGDAPAFSKEVDISSSSSALFIARKDVMELLKSLYGQEKLTVVARDYGGVQLVTIFPIRYAENAFKPVLEACGVAL